RGHGDQPGLDRQAAAGERTIAFAPVVTVVAQVQQVIEDVNAGGAEAEAEEGKHSVPHQVELGETMRGEQGHEDQGVLQPLVQAHRPAPVAQAGRV
nr:hypothetical protein [Tanacetum cinerariifolium]